MEATIEAACQSRAIPGAVILAADKTGKFSYANTFGVRSLQAGAPLAEEPLTVDTIMWIASCTKLVTSIAALQCVERGNITLDEDVRPILHEFQDFPILERSKNGDAIIKCKNTTPITLRQLLTHTAGFAYEETDPLLEKWLKQQPESERRPPTSVHNRFLHPLIYEPGTSWCYSPSIDWAGVLIERITGTNLQDYMRQHIWEPLGITDMTFFLSTRPDLQARVAHMSQHNGTEDISSAELSHSHHAELQPALGPDKEDASGGGGIWTSPAEYFKILRALLAASDAPEDVSSVPPGQLLRRSSVDAIFTPQLGTASRAHLQAMYDKPRSRTLAGGMHHGTSVDWGLAGLLGMEELPGWRRKGTLSWGGSPNLFWWIDREAGLCGLYAGQVMEIPHAKSTVLSEMFEKEMYARYSVVQNALEAST